MTLNLISLNKRPIHIASTNYNTIQSNIHTFMFVPNIYTDPTPTAYTYIYHRSTDQSSTHAFSPVCPTSNRDRESPGRPRRTRTTVPIDWTRRPPRPLPQTRLRHHATTTTTPPLRWSPFAADRRRPPRCHCPQPDRRYCDRPPRGHCFLRTLGCWRPAAGHHRRRLCPIQIVMSP